MAALIERSYSGHASGNDSKSNDPNLDDGLSCVNGLRYLIVRPENGGIRDIIKYARGDIVSGLKFLETNYGLEDEIDSVVDGIAADHRWVILVSIIVRKIIAFFAKPMEWTGHVVEWVLNLLSENDNLFGLLCNLVHGKMVIPQRGTETFLSTIGHLDRRIDLCRGLSLNVEMENRALMDLCMMASKLAYENAEVVRKVVHHHWKMHFVEFYNCWNEFQKEFSTQVFLLCDKPKDADLILISFRGTEPFDADDWITDFDYSWYEIPKLGKVHMGFLEALGLGNRVIPTTFQNRLQVNDTRCDPSSTVVDAGIHPWRGSTKSMSYYTDSDIGQGGQVQFSDSEGSISNGSTRAPKKLSAYDSVKSKLKILLQEHKNAKFLVTGHSLGGALAILFPTVLVLHEEKEVMQRLLGVYTFGQPRVGNRDLTRFMEAHLEHPVPKYFRLVYCNDLVPRLPYDNTTFLYKHFGVCLYFDSLYIDQRVDEEPNRNYYGMRYILPLYLNAFWELLRSFIMEYICGPGV
ncbi:Lipase [Quillaja saponaria]|uniref:Lipase n=1 Tax=Quillaja saponaria TaxID=32244 RepID=A0AAD7LU03_QUISA|nr:Lipase [Quillaja saponaria]